LCSFELMLYVSMDTYVYNDTIMGISMQMVVEFHSVSKEIQ